MRDLSEYLNNPVPLTENYTDYLNSVKKKISNVLLDLQLKVKNIRNSGQNKVHLN